MPPISKRRRQSREKLAAFLEKCNYCTKRIGKDKDVFMYRDFGAFCSVECRAYQMEYDARREKEQSKR